MCSHSKTTNNSPFAQILMSINSVVMSVAASYRTLKRGAVTFRHTIFIYLSLLCQVFFLQKTTEKTKTVEKATTKTVSYFKNTNFVILRFLPEYSAS